MTTTKDGGPAFPSDSACESWQCRKPHSGMTLRDYIAAHAMTGLLQNSQYPAGQVAKAAVSFADALIAELETKQED